MNEKKYTFDDLVNLSNEELGHICDKQKQKLHQLHSKKFSLCGKILFYQEKIEEMKK